MRLFYKTLKNATEKKKYISILNNYLMLRIKRTGFMGGNDSYVDHSELFFFCPKNKTYPEKCRLLSIEKWKLFRSTNEKKIILIDILCETVDKKVKW